MKKKSETRKKHEPDFRAVYADVDRRSEGRCEVSVFTMDAFWTDGLRVALGLDPSTRCRRRAADHHHTVKPRAEHTTPEEVIAVCRPCHDRCEWPYKRGRLEIVPNGDGTFRCAIVTAPDKFTYRTQQNGER